MSVKRCLLVHDEHVPERAAFPVIDAHNHLWAKWDSLENVLAVMDGAGVAAYADLTANVSVAWGGGGYTLGAGDFDAFVEHVTRRYPGRFYGFTTATFARPHSEPLFTDARRFVEETVTLLRQHVAKGARGLKILKELGLHYRDGNGDLVMCDDERLAPIWDEAASLRIPVLIHQADPFGFFEPVTPENEHFASLLKYPAWSFCDTSRFPGFDELQRRYRTLIGRHPGTTFLLPHMANWPENIAYVARLLDEHPNVYVDFSARLDELGRQPHTARDFLIRYQDRIYFGTDMPASLPMYRCYFRFLETFDEWFVPPDYDGTFERFRWHICGVGLPSEVLAKLYFRNALKIIPKLKKELPWLDRL